MALIDLLRFFIPVSAIIAVFWCVSFIARISEPKPLVFGVDDNTEFRLHWIYKISVVVIDITCLLVAIFLIWGSIMSGPRVLVAPMFWVIIAVFSILFLYILYIHKSFSDVYVRIDSQGINVRKFYGRRKNIPYTDISEYIFKPHSDKLIIKDFRGRKTLIRPLKTSSQLSLFHLAFRMTEGRWAQSHSTDDRRKLEESIETNSGVQYLLDHLHGKLS